MMGRRHRMAHAKMLVSLSLLLPYALSYPTTAEGVQVLGNHALLYNGKIYFPLGHLNANAESLRDQDFACKVGQVLLDNVGNHTRSTSQSEQFEWFTRDFYSSNAKPGKATGKTTGKETGKATGKAAGKGTAEDEVECPVYSEGESRIPFGTPSFWFYAGISLALVLVGGLMSGLTVGFSSIDPLRLDILMASDLPSDQEDKKRAQKVGPILHDHHKLLVTLLLTNAAAMEALPIFLDRIFPSYVAIILSVTFVLFFGEIIPQALCTKSPLSIGAAWAPFVRLVMTLELPLTYPIAKILDCVLGDDAKRYLFRRSELATLIGFHAVKHMKGGDLREVDEVRIIQGALGLRDVKVKDAMITEIFTMSDDTILSATVMAEIMARGFSRIPIYKDKPQNIVGMLLTKRLILVDPDDEIPVRNILARKPLVVPETMDLYTLLNVFQQKHCHLALVIKDSKDLAAFKNAMSDAKKDVPDHVKITGLITVEDVIEELIQEEIYDETDSDKRLALYGYRKWRNYVKRKKESKLGKTNEAGILEKTIQGAIKNFESAGRRNRRKRAIKDFIRRNSKQIVVDGGVTEFKVEILSPKTKHSDGHVPRAPTNRNTNENTGLLSVVAESQKYGST